MTMQQVALEQAEPRMVLAKPIFDPEGTLLLKEGLRLTDRYIERLADFGIRVIWVADPD